MPAPLGADDEEVEALLVDLGAEADRFDGARLADQPVDRRQLGGGGEAEARRIAAAIELLGRQGRQVRAGGRGWLDHVSPSLPAFGVAAKAARVGDGRQDGARGAARGDRPSPLTAAVLYKAGAAANRRRLRGSLRPWA